ncbi:MAG: hypothetical protein ACRDZO_17435 [Egibacteraceae bacterium]
MPVTLTRDADGVATVGIDDGKVNALDVDVFRELGVGLWFGAVRRRGCIRR